MVKRLYDADAPFWKFIMRNSAEENDIFEW